MSVKVTIPRDDYNPNQRTDIDVEVVNPDGTVSTRTVKGAVQATTQEDGSVSIGILASAHVPFVAAAGYESAVLADSPLVYWRLGESSGTTAADASGNGRSGTYASNNIGSAPTLGVTGAISDGDTAVDFNITDQPRVEIDDAAWMDTSYVSVECWVKTTQSTGLPSYIVCREHDGTSDRQYSLRMDASGKAELLVFNTGGSNSSPSGSTSINDGNWHHIVGTWDGTTVRVYVDGSLDGSASFSGTLRAVNQPIRVALRRAAGSPAVNLGDYFDGVVDEVAIYSTALSSTRVAAHYAAA